MQQLKEKQKRRVFAETIELDKEVWFAKYKQLSTDKLHHVLLESGRGARYNFIGLDPVAILQGKGQSLTITQNDHSITKQGNLLDLMREYMGQYQIEPIKNGPPFQGGAIGYLSYDIVREIERIPTLAIDDLKMDDLYFLVFEDVMAYDHKENKLWIMTCALDKVAAIERLEHYYKQWSRPESECTDYEQRAIKAHEIQTSLTEDEFVKAVEKIQNYIAQGDVFQVNLSVRQAKPLQTESFHVYEKLRDVNPSPYMSYFHTPAFQLISGSPELLIKKKGQEVCTRPIAGTRSRGANDEEDKRLAKTLIENEKERAEHVMLVDLERNDLGRVCQFGTVEVNELMVIEKYSHVMHIVSNVRGIVDTNRDAYDIIRATFPGGTITGAPKIRTMEIIEELEPVRRGIYTGSIGWIGFDGDMELNIVIRTILAKDGYAYVQAGAGIVIDSNPKAEFKESLKKARALMYAMELSEEEVSKVKTEQS